MALHSMLNPDPMRYPRLVPKKDSVPGGSEPDAGEQPSESRGGPVFRGPEEVPADLALDLRLHEILEQARLATAATGAVIALARGEEMICRATSGSKAPALGVSLDTRSGLSAACVRTCAMQSCEDTLADPRVNANACRELEIRSIMVLPVLVGEELRGIFEIFSSAPQAFSVPDIQALQALCRRVSQTVRDAAEESPVTGEESAPRTDESAPPTGFSALRAMSLETPPQPETMAREIFRASEQLNGRSRHRDYWTAALTASVIILAVLLGWMVGRAGWSMAVNRAQAQLPTPPQESQAAMPATPDVVSPAAEPAKVSAETVPAAPAAKPSPKPTAQPKGRSAENPAGGLVVYEQGKVVFRMAPSDKAAPAGATSAGATAANQEGDSASPDVGAGTISPPESNSYLLERVEPEYPDDARQQHIEGPVVLRALVGTDGAVKELKVISGDPVLIKAAQDAVRQWRFKPHRLKGRPVEFETQITVKFALP
jgi:TonB family protein